MAELPRDFVLFCLLDRPEGVSWNSDETSPLVDIGLEELRQRGELLCVLVDGSVVRFNLKSAGCSECLQRLRRNRLPTGGMSDFFTEVMSDEAQQLGRETERGRSPIRMVNPWS